jgi:hypothetical protein
MEIINGRLSYSTNRYQHADKELNHRLPIFITTNNPLHLWCEQSGKEPLECYGKTAYIGPLPKLNFSSRIHTPEFCSNLMTYFRSTISSHHHTGTADKLWCVMA